MAHEVILHYGPKSGCSLRIDLEDGSLTLDECKISPTEWSALKRRVDKVLNRRGFGEPKAPPVQTPRGTKFIIKNLKTLNEVQRGYVKPAPKALRRWFDWVITKEDYGS